MNLENHFVTGYKRILWQYIVNTYNLSSSLNNESVNSWCETETWNFHEKTNKETYPLHLKVQTAAVMSHFSVDVEILHE